MSLRAALKFSPKRLRRAVRDAVELHPNTARSLTGVAGDSLEQLLQRLRACGDDPIALSAFGAELTGREHRGLLSALVRLDPELSPLIEGALGGHLRPFSLASLWRAWQQVPRDRTTLSLLRVGATEFGMGSTVERGWAERADAWVTGDPLSEIVGWAANESIRVEELPRLAGSPLTPETPLIDEIWRTVLTTGSADQLLNEDPDEIHARGFSLGPAHVQAFGRNYLTELPINRWRLAVLEELRRRYGLPDASTSRPAFWDPLADEPKTAFRRFFLKRELKRAFGGGSDRHEYWEGWVDAMRDITTGVAGGTDYAIIEFAPFGVVEFFEVGNAAYFYDRDTVARVKRVRPANPRDLKEAGSDRLIHNQGWQWKADAMMARRLGRRR